MARWHRHRHTRAHTYYNIGCKRMRARARCACIVRFRLRAKHNFCSRTFSNFRVHLFSRHSAYFVQPTRYTRAPSVCCTHTHTRCLALSLWRPVVAHIVIDSGARARVCVHKLRTREYTGSAGRVPSKLDKYADWGGERAMKVDRLAYSERARSIADGSALIIYPWADVCVCGDLSGVNAVIRNHCTGSPLRVRCRFFVFFCVSSSLQCNKCHPDR